VAPILASEIWTRLEASLLTEVDVGSVVRPVTMERNWNVLNKRTKNIFNV